MPDDADLHIYDSQPRTAKLYRCPTCGEKTETSAPRPRCANDGAELGRIPR